MINKQNYKVWDKKSTKVILGLMDSILGGYQNRASFYDYPEWIGTDMEKFARLELKNEQDEYEWCLLWLSIYKDTFKLYTKFNITHSIFKRYGVNIQDLKIEISDYKRQIKKLKLQN